MFYSYLIPLILIAFCFLWNYSLLLNLFLYFFRLINYPKKFYVRIRFFVIFLSNLNFLFVSFHNFDSSPNISSSNFQIFLYILSIHHLNIFSNLNHWPLVILILNDLISYTVFFLRRLIYHYHPRKNYFRQSRQELARMNRYHLYHFCKSRTFLWWNRESSENLLINFALFLIADIRFRINLKNIKIEDRWDLLLELLNEVVFLIILLCLFSSVLLNYFSLILLLPYLILFLCAFLCLILLEIFASLIRLCLLIKENDIDCISSYYSPFDYLCYYYCY